MKLQNLTIAVQKKGRLNDASTAFLATLGIAAKPNGRKFIGACKKTGIDVLFVRDDDIPQYVSSGVVDFGIVGKNVLAEKDVFTNNVKQLDFGVCRLVIASPKNSSIKSVGDLEGTRVATSYPTLLKKYLESKNIKASIVDLKGSVEIAPKLNLADAVCDLVQTGQTLEENELVQIETIMESTAVLIESPINNANKEKFLNLI